jgi:hypothetical protein
MESLPKLEHPFSLFRGHGCGRWIVVTLLSILSIVGSCIAGVIELRLPAPADFESRPYNLELPSDLVRLRADAQRLAELSEQQEAALADQRRAATARTSPDQMTLAELKELHTSPAGHISKRERRGLKAIRREAATLLQNPTEPARAQSVAAIHELVAAIDNGRRPSAPRDVDTFQVPIVLASHLSSPVARGRRPAANLLPSSAAEATDLSLLDPQPGTFWQRPDSVASLDLYHGFGRTALPRIDGRLCEYSAPKTSLGGNPGFDVVCDGWRIKVKFGETTSEPFTARIFWALGYHVDPTDYANALRIRYDRRIFREFHLRRDILMTFRALWFIPIHTINLQQRYDPFDYFVAAVLTDGTRITGRELKQQLFYDPSQPHPEDDPANFRTSFEARIHYLVTVPVNLQYRNTAVDSIGPWDFGQLGHQHRRELRGAGLLAAWLNWFDSRFENTRLKTIEQGDVKELAHFFSDLGGTLGRGEGFYSGRGELPEEFDWTFTRSARGFWPLRRSVPFRITGFKPIERTLAFQEMTLDDARWMARLIAQLSERQLIDALIAAGFDSAHVRLYTEKLVSRRDQMIRDLGLNDRIPPLRPHGVDRHFTYVPAVDGPVRSLRRDGREIVARASDAVVANGRVVRISMPQPETADLAVRSLAP